ncbi:MAG TPA: S9 family peptidase, partial [Lysobacter sp.]
MTSTPFRSEDLYLHRTLQDLSGTPAHSRTVFVRSRASRRKDMYRSTAWVVDTAAGARTRARQLTSANFNARSLIVDAAGERMAFLSARDPDAGQQVHLLPLDGGEARAVTRTPARETIKSLYAWSHDGRRLLGTQAFAWCEDEHDDHEAKSRPWVVRHLPYKLDGTGPKVGKRTRLVEIDVDGGAVRTLVEGDFDVADARWSPDGRVLAYSRKRSGLQRHQADLWIADADGGNARQITSDLYSVSGLSFSPDGRTLAFAASAIEGDSVMGLYFYDIESGARRCPGSDDLQLEGATVIWHPDGRRVATIASRKGLFEIAVVDVESGAVTPVERGLRHVTELMPGGDGLVFVASSMRECDELYRVDWDGGNERRLTAFNRKWFRQRPRPHVEKRAFEVPDAKGGTERIDAWILRPEQGDGPFPVLVDFHGGPQSVALIDYASHVYWWELVAKGWMVVAPNPVGSGGYGGEFARRLRGHWGEYDLPQIEAIIATLQDEKLADDRLACYGKSYGGYLSAWSAANSERFKAAVVSAPVINLLSHGGTSDSGYYVTPYAMGSELHENHEVYARLSPVEYAAKVRTATLMLQGQDDQRCPLGQSEEFYANLIRAGHRN